VPGWGGSSSWERDEGILRSNTNPGTAPRKIQCKVDTKEQPVRKDAGTPGRGCIKILEKENKFRRSGIRLERGAKNGE